MPKNGDRKRGHNAQSLLRNPVSIYLAGKTESIIFKLTKTLAIKLKIAENRETCFAGPELFVRAITLNVANALKK